MIKTKIRKKKDLTPKLVINHLKEEEMVEQVKAKLYKTLQQQIKREKKVKAKATINL